MGSSILDAVLSDGGVSLMAAGTTLASARRLSPTQRVGRRIRNFLAKFLMFTGGASR